MYHRCVSQLIAVVKDYADCLKNKKQIDAILLDLSKAFDKVDLNGLILKLEHLGIRNSLLGWTKSFLLGRTQRVLVEGKASAPRPVLSGVPQGTVLGPLFFLIYINDLSKGLSKGTKLKLFADDSLLYRTIETPADSKALQNDLDLLQVWEQKWKMEFHPGKCQFLRITNKHKIFHSDYYIHGIKVKRTETAQYLGVVIDGSLSWKNQYHHVIQKANKILGLISRNFHHCPLHIKSQCYTTLVRPILEYACSVWDPHHQIDIELLEKVQKRAARFVTGNYTWEHGNSDLNLKTLGWDTLQERRIRNKLITLQKARLELIDIPIEHLDFKTRQTRFYDESSYAREFSDIDGHRFSFFPDTTHIWNHLSKEERLSEDIDNFTSYLNTVDLTTLRYDIRVTGGPIR